MNSLQDLNDYSDSTLTFVDLRPSGVGFDRRPPLYATNLEVQFDGSLTAQCVPTIDITDIVNYDEADVRYRMTINNISGAGSAISLATLPAHMSSSVVGDVTTVSGFQTVADWEAVKTFNWLVPSSYTTNDLFWLEVEIIWYDNVLGADQSREWVVFDPDHYYYAQLESTATMSPTGRRFVGGEANLAAEFTFEEYNVQLNSEFTLNATSPYGFISIQAEADLSGAFTPSMTANATKRADVELDVAITMSTSADKLLGGNITLPVTSFTIDITATKIALFDTNWDETYYFDKNFDTDITETTAPTINDPWTSGDTPLADQPVYYVEISVDTGSIYSRHNFSTFFNGSFTILKETNTTTNPSAGEAYLMGSDTYSGALYYQSSTPTNFYQKHYSVNPTTSAFGVKEDINDWLAELVYLPNYNSTTDATATVKVWLLDFNDINLYDAPYQSLTIDETSSPDKTITFDINYSGTTGTIDDQILTLEATRLQGSGGATFINTPNVASYLYGQYDIFAISFGGGATGQSGGGGGGEYYTASGQTITHKAFLVGAPSDGGSDYDLKFGFTNTYQLYTDFTNAFDIQTLAHGENAVGTTGGDDATGTYTGGTGVTVGSYKAGGGGAGASSNGTSAADEYTPGDGGDGVVSSITGTAVEYGAGGAGVALSGISIQSTGDYLDPPQYGQGATRSDSSVGENGAVIIKYYAK